VESVESVRRPIIIFLHVEPVDAHVSLKFLLHLKCCSSHVLVGVVVQSVVGGVLVAHAASLFMALFPPLRDTTPTTQYVPSNNLTVKYAAR